MLLLNLALVAGLLAYLYVSFRAGSWRIPKSPLLFAIALIPLAYFVSALATGVSWESIVGVGVEQDTVAVVFLFFVLFLVSAHVFAASTDRIKMFFLLLLGGSAILVLVQYVRLLFPSFTFGGVLLGPASSIIGSWHDLAIFLSLVVYISLALLSTEVAANRPRRAFFVGLALFSGVLILVSNFSDVWLGLAGLGALQCVFLWRQGVNVGRSKANIVRTWVPWIILVLLAVGLSWGGTYVHNVLPERIRVVQLEVRPSWVGTFAIGEGAFTQPNAIFFGSGPNSFPREWGLYKPIEVNSTQFWDVDFYQGVGFIPTAVVTIGLLGLLAWGAVTLVLLHRAFLTLRSHEAPWLPVQRIIVGSALYLTIFHALYTPGPALSIITFIFLGVLVAAGLSSGVGRAWNLSLSLITWQGKTLTAVAALLAILVLLGTIQSSRAVLAEAFVNRALALYAKDRDLAATSRSISYALLLLPQSDRAHRSAVELGILQLGEMIARGETSDDARAALQAKLTQTIEHGLAAVSIEDSNYQNWLTLAHLYRELAGAGIEGAEQNARSAYMRARENNPTNPLPLVGLAQLDLLKNDDASAAENLSATLAIKPDLGVAHFLLSQVYARKSDFENARLHASTVVQIAPDDPLGWNNLGTILYAERNFTLAATAFERAVGLENNYANALYLLGLSYENLGRREDALSALRAVAELNPNDDGLKQAIARLEASAAGR